MEYKSVPAQRAVRACGREYFFSKIIYILGKYRQGKQFPAKLQRRYAPWLEWLAHLEPADRAEWLSFILNASDDCPAALVSTDLWPGLWSAWQLFRQNTGGVSALLAELRLYDLLFPRATNVDWRRRLDVLSGNTGEDPQQFFADILVEQAPFAAPGDPAWNEAALNLLTGGRRITNRATAIREMLCFFDRIRHKPRHSGILLYHGCRQAVPALKENSTLEHWFFSGLMALFAGSECAGRLCDKLNCGEETLAGQHWWYPYFQLWLSVEFPVLARILLPRQCVELFRPFGDMPVEIIIRNLPLFMLKKLPELMRNPRDKQLVLYLARGNNIRTAPRLPFPMTKKMAHCFVLLSDAADTREAFWLAFGQSCGADNRVLNGFRQFWRLPEIREDGAFLQSAMTFAQQAGYDGPQLNMVVGYWRHTWHETRGNYSLSGRTPASVFRQAETFYRVTQNRFPLHKMTVWRAHPTLKPFLQHTESGVYSIVELTSSYDLHEEGRMMHHCVGSYVWQCRQGGCSIWSLRFSDGLSKKTLVTIQLNAAGRIVQARGRQNRLPSTPEMAVIQQWTQEQGIRVERV